jgi:hypothetical protein
MRRSAKAQAAEAIVKKSCCRLIFVSSAKAGPLAPSHEAAKGGKVLRVLWIGQYAGFRQDDGE